MEEVNLALGSLGASVCCSVPSREGYSAEGLLQGGPWMAEGWIKAPVGLYVVLLM